MKKHTKIIIAALISVLLISVLAVGASMLTKDEYEALKEERAELAKQNEALTSQLKDMNGELDSKYAELESILEASNSTALKQQSYTELLASCMDRYNAEKELLSVTTEMMNSINGEISMLEERHSKIENSIVETVRNLHETGSAGYIEFLFESKSIIELLNRFEYVTSIMEHYNKLIGDAEKSTKLLEDRYAELETLRNTQQETVFLLESRRATYDAMIAECIQNLEELKAESETLNKYFETKNDEITKIENQISGIVGKLDNIDELLKDYESESFFWPCKDYYYVTSEFGGRDLWGSYNVHKGIDIGVRYQDVYASKTGVVVKAEYSSSYGYYMVLAHPNGIQTWYAHLSKMHYKEGDTVKGGTVIGVSGNSGWSTGPHLHFEIRVNGSYVNPLNYKKLGLTGVNSYVKIP